MRHGILIGKEMSGRDRVEVVMVVDNVRLGPDTIREVPEMIDYNGNEDAVDGKCEVIYIKYGSNVSALFYPDPIRA